MAGKWAWKGVLKSSTDIPIETNWFKKIKIINKSLLSDLIAIYIIQFIACEWVYKLRTHYTHIAHERT